MEFSLRERERERRNDQKLSRDRRSRNRREQSTAKQSAKTWFPETQEETGGNSATADGDVDIDSTEDCFDYTLTPQNKTKETR